MWPAARRPHRLPQARRRRQPARQPEVTLLAGALTAVSAGSKELIIALNVGGKIGSAVTDEAASMGSWVGWRVAVLATLIFLMKVCAERYELRAKKRPTMRQSPTTYEVCPSQSRFSFLPEESFGAWPMD